MEGYASLAILIICFVVVMIIYSGFFFDSKIFGDDVQSEKHTADTQDRKSYGLLPEAVVPDTICDQFAGRADTLYAKRAAELMRENTDNPEMFLAYLREYNEINKAHSND